MMNEYRTEIKRFEVVIYCSCHKAKKLGVSMKDGIYKLIFNTNVNLNGQLDGIVVVNAGKINGGDYVCFYKGEVIGTQAFIKSTPHNHKDTTAFNGHSPLELEIRFEDHTSHYLFKGHLKDDPKQVIHGQLNYLSSLA